MTASSPISTAGAVFLSYAREDSAAVRRIADALRAAGIEVWFDQNELVGGDTWDQKIRQQVKECALFVPVISGHTQARREGYFRLEWHLAEDRMRQIAKGTPFLVPVVIDGTVERDAIAPEAFLAVQWTRLPAGETASAFVARMQKLLGGTSAAHAAAVPATPASAKAAATAKSGQPPWFTFALGAAVLALIAYVVLRPAAKEVPASAPTKSVAEAKPAAEKKAPTPSPAAPAVPLAPDKSIAVLPFANMSPDKDNEFFADGVHEDVITNLAKIRDLKVISRTSVLAYRDTASRNLKKIAAELGVATVLEGSVRRVGTKVRVTAQLIDARTDEHLWAETYDKDLTDVFAIQSTLATEIAAALKANFTVGERALVGARLTQNSEAYDLYLKARALWETPGTNNAPGPVVREVTERTIALYEQAVAKDPAFGAAYAQLTYLHGRMFWYEYLDPTPARRERARAALDAAVRIAPNQPETHLALGAYAYYADNDWSRALKEFQAGEASLPNDAQLHYFIALTLRRLGRYDESIAHFNRSLELSPRDYLCANQLLQTLEHVRRFTDVRELTTRCLTFYPGDGTLMSIAADARFALDHDAAAFLRTKEALAAEQGSGVVERNYYLLAMMQGDYAAAERALASPRLKTMVSLGALLNDPADRYRALAVFLGGDRDRARVLAGQAMEYYQTHTWISRQTGAVKLGMALCEALTGHSDQALALVKEAYEWQLTRDVFVAEDYFGLITEIYFVLGRDEDTLATLRTMMTKPSGTYPDQIRLSPFFSRVKNDPRFEEYLKLAKPL